MKKSIILLCLAGWALGCTYDEVQVKNSDVIHSLMIGQSSLPADAFSRTTVTAELPIDTDAGKRTVEFTTTGGTFAEADGKNTVSMVAIQDESTQPFRLLARATLISPQTTGTAVITARTAGYADIKTCTFTTALPDNLTITPSQLVLKQGAENEVTLTVTLLRNTGKPSLNQVAGVTISGLDGKPRGRFRGDISASDASGKCQAVYTLGNEKYTGKLVVQATANQKIKTDTLYAQ